MNRLASFSLLVGLLAASPALAQTLTDTGTPLPSPEATDSFQVETLLENFDKATARPDVRTYGNGPTFGYTFGTGPMNFKVAEAFTLPGGATSTLVLGANLHFGVKSVTPTRTTYPVQIWSGTPQSGPQAQLFSQEFPIADIQLSNTGPVPTPVRFSAPVTVSGTSFFVVMPFDLSSVGDSLAIATTGQRAPGEFIRNTWHAVNGAWIMTNQFVMTGGAPLQTWMWIDALIDDVTPSTERLPEGLTSVRLFPNPAPEAGSVEIDLAREADVRVTVVDLLGRATSDVFSGALPAGRRVLDLQTDRLPAATYVVRVEIDGAPVTRLLTVTR